MRCVVRNKMRRCALAAAAVRSCRAKPAHAAAKCYHSGSLESKACGRTVESFAMSFAVGEGSRDRKVGHFNEWVQRASGYAHTSTIEAWHCSPHMYAKKVYRHRPSRTLLPASPTPAEGSYSVIDYIFRLRWAHNEAGQEVCIPQ